MIDDQHLEEDQLRPAPPPRVHDTATTPFRVESDRVVSSPDVAPPGIPADGTSPGGPRPDTTIVIPTRNESGNVRPLVERLSVALRGRTAELVFVDDSTDDTPQQIVRVAEGAGLPIRVIHRAGPERTGGLAGAVRAGVLASSSDFVVVMDGDLQHPPELAPALRDAAEHADVSVASRYLGAAASPGLRGRARRLVSGASNVLARLCFPRRVGRVCTDPMAGYFCFRRSSVDVSRLHPRGFKILFELLVRHQLRVTEIPLTLGEREHGASKAGWRSGGAYLWQVLALRLGGSALVPRLLLATGATIAAFPDVVPQLTRVDGLAARAQVVAVVASGAVLLASRMHPAGDEPDVHDRQLDLIAALPLFALAAWLSTGPAPSGSLPSSREVFAVTAFVSGTALLLLGTRVVARVRVVLLLPLLALPAVAGNPPLSVPLVAVVVVTAAKTYVDRFRSGRHATSRPRLSGPLDVLRLPRLLPAAVCTLALAAALSLVGLPGGESVDLPR